MPGRFKHKLAATALLCLGLADQAHGQFRLLPPSLQPIADTSAAPTETSPLMAAPLMNQGRFGSMVSTDQPAATLDSEWIEPIDWLTVLRLSGEQNLDIRIARERVAIALADLQQSQTLLLPSLYYGPNWIRHDGQAQLIDGVVKPISKSSLFVGSTASAGSGIGGPIPAGGPAQVGGLTSIIRFSDAIYEPMANRQILQARQAGIFVAEQNALLAASELYLDLQAAAGRLAIAREAASLSASLVQVTKAYFQAGKGLEADLRRSQTELDRRNQQVEASVAELEGISAELARLLRLNQRSILAPIEPPEMSLELVSSEIPTDDLIVMGLTNRPELAESQAIVQATIIKLKQARMRPFIPSLAFRYSGGAFGGGPNSYFGDFNGRSDADVNLYWQLQGMGFADRAIKRRSEAESRAADLELLKVQDRVAADVASAHRQLLANVRRRIAAARAIPDAQDSVRKNFDAIKQGAGLTTGIRAIETLQPIQALAQAETDLLDAHIAENRSQIRLYYALGQPLARAAAPNTSPADAAAMQPAAVPAPDSVNNPLQNR
jgi:outer membrane protein TolC